jgi:hypothetical protein
LLVAADTSGQSDRDLYVFGSAMVAGGLSYFCAWGPGCERLHDLVDDAFIAESRDPEQEFTLMTTWHDNEPLSDAIHFCLEHAAPEGTFAEGCSSTVLAVVGNASWASQVEAAVLAFRADSY